MSDKPKNVFETIKSTEEEKREAELSSKIQKKMSAESRAEEVIYAALCNWTGEQVSNNTPIPIYRSGRRVGEIDKTLLGHGNSVRSIIKSAGLLKLPDLQSKIDQFEDIISKAMALSNALNALEREDFYSLNFQFGERWYTEVDERVVSAVGYSNAAMISTAAISNAMAKSVLELKEEAKNRVSKPGRPRDEAAYKVAAQLAKLYAKVTGVRPTYSENSSGLSGEFTPVLGNVFAALGWEDRTLRGPAEEACKSVSEEDLQYETTHPFLRLSGYKKT
jgi:hypothetical protein